MHQSSVKAAASCSVSSFYRTFVNGGGGFIHNNPTALYISHIPVCSMCEMGKQGKCFRMNTQILKKEVNRVRCI